MAIRKWAAYAFAITWAAGLGAAAAPANGGAVSEVVRQCRDLSGLHEKGFPVRPVQPAAIDACERAAKAAPANMEVPAYLARAYYAAKRGDEAFAAAQRSAHGGSAVGMAALGVTYEFGHGTRVDAARAREWYQRGAGLGNAWAQCNYAALIGREEGELPTQREESARWFLKSAEQGFAVAQGRLGALYRRGQGVEKNPAEALRWLTRAREQGDALASHVLGFMYDNGDGVEKSELRAVNLYLEAAQRGRDAANDKVLLNLFLGKVPAAAIDSVLAYA